MGGLQQTRQDASSAASSSAASSSAASYQVASKIHEPWRTLESNFIPTVGSIPELPKSFPILEAEGQMVDIMFLCCSLHVMAIASAMYVFESNKFVLLTER
jgi:hypothetical protein